MEKYKVIKVTELCEVDYINSEDVKVEDEILHATRIIHYPTIYKNLVTALIDYEDNFNINKMIETYDNFEGCCLCSEVVGIEFSNEYDDMSDEQIESYFN